MTQNERIKRHLEVFGKISSREAMNEYGIMRLGARVWELKNQEGMKIVKTMKHDLNRFGEKTCYAEYRLVG